MISFFRKIRQKLLQQNRLTQYLIYALGEILLVVIGILIAVQVNNWNLDRIDQKAEKNALQDLKEEFADQTKRLADAQKRRELSIAFFSKKLEFMKSGMLDSLTAYHPILYLGIVTLNAPNGVINSLISSGQINLISNDSLKYRLASWSEAVEDIREEEDNHFRFVVTEFLPYLQRNLPLTIVNFSTVDSKGEQLFYSEKQVKEYYSKIIQDIEYQNLCVMNINWNQIAILEYNNLQRELEQIRSLIESELGN
ncbi:hypothetical protein SAMN04488519_103191 [Algoriphagus ornithinivorans]|uniref:Uncharacterized protein n=1 Tax=Algoriphagus ornithinivorans TaxID=226506 RepID=A0A1I5DXF5_9BACT|nr:hypothetical protein [Algoriphagus ornithinivorans]SFO03889.1 hypothetical protein SAMN04488519_103191 [Algoriphagus ornithinivorans]